MGMLFLSSTLHTHTWRIRMHILWICTYTHWVNMLWRRRVCGRFEQVDSCLLLPPVFVQDQYTHVFTSEMWTLLLKNAHACRWWCSFTVYGHCSALHTHTHTRCIRMPIYESDIEWICFEERVCGRLSSKVDVCLLLPPVFVRDQYTHSGMQTFLWRKIKNAHAYL